MGRAGPLPKRTQRQRRSAGFARRPYWPKASEMEEVKPSLRNMVEATLKVRESLRKFRPVRGGMRFG